MTIFGDPLWAELLSLANIVFALSMGIMSIVGARRNHGYYRTLLIVLAVLGFYWAALYTWVFITPADYINSVAFGQIFVRPAFTLTLAVLASIAVYQWRVRRG